MADDGSADVVLRPRLGGSAGTANPFARFKSGAGAGIKTKKATSAAAVDDVVVKPDSERVKYARDFLMLFMERYTKCPLEVAQLGMPEIVISEESERDQQRKVLQTVAETVADERDWRTRDAVPSVAVAAPKAATAQDASSSWERGKEPQRDQAAALPAAPQQTQPAAQATSSPASSPAAPPAAAPAPVTAAEPLATMKIAKAADQGLQAYRPGAQTNPEERAMRTIKGILNKLTPEKFDRLLNQLLEVVTSADILQHTIGLVFENAVEQPTYCAMYADLCFNLSKQLPSFPPPPGSNRSIAFRQILLNTCQDEFEGMEAAREALTTITEAPAREAAERSVKKRTLGNMRLLSELYKQDMVKDWIMTQCMETLLTPGKGKVPSEDNIEAACEMITTAGGRLSKSDKPETKTKLDAVMKLLEKLATERSVPSRIRFIIRDIMDLRKANWVARREVFTAKKLDDIRTQAEAELGMVSSTMSAALPNLPGRPGGGLEDTLPLLPQLRAGAGLGVGSAALSSVIRPGSEADMLALFPPLRSQMPPPSSSYSAAPAPPAGGDAKKSAFLGEYQEIATAAPPAQAAAPAAAAAQQPAATGTSRPAVSESKPAAAPSGPLSAEDVQRKTDSLLREYTNTLDKAEALTCVKELGDKASMPEFVERVLAMLLESFKEKEQSSLQELLLYCAAQGQLSGADLQAGLQALTSQLDDISVDAPKAPQLLGALTGAAINAKALPLSCLPALLEGGEDEEYRRAYLTAVLKAVQSAVGEAGMAAACTEAGATATALMAGAQGTDGPVSEASLKEWLASEGLSSVPLS